MKGGSPGRSQDLPALLSLLLLWAWFHHRVLFGGETFFLVDCSGFFSPFWKWGSRWVDQGFLPLWIPDVAFGRPYWADPEMDLWYPPLRAAYALVDPDRAFRFLIVGHHLWGAVGSYFFSRNRGYSPWASLAGCLAFAFSFNAVSLMEIPAILFAYSWIPWVFLAGWRLWERPSSRTGFAFSLCLALQAASGYPLFAYLTAFFLFGDLGIRSLILLSTTPGALGKIKSWLGWAAWGGLAAVLYNSAWLIPFAEFLRYSNIDQRLTMTQGLQWKNLASWFNPFYAGHPFHSYVGVDPMFSVYFIGLPFLVLLIWGVLRRRIEGSTFFIFLLAFVLSAGSLFRFGVGLKALLPGFQWVVRSGYLIPWVVFYGVWISLQALSRLGEDPEKERAPWLLTVALAGAGALGLGVPVDLISFWLGLLFLGLAGFLMARNRVLGEGLLVAALLCSLGPVAQNLNYTVRGSFYQEEPAALSAMTLDGRIFHDYSVVQKGEAAGGSSVQNAYERLRGDLVPNWPLNYGREEVFDHGSFFLKGFLKWWYGAPRISKAFSKKVLDYLDVRYFYGTEPGPGFKKMGTGLAPDPLWVNPSPLTKWNSITRSLRTVSWDQDLLWAASHGFDFSTDCFVPEDLRSDFYVRRKLTIETKGPNGLAISALGQGKALLASSETAFPGWVVKVEGQNKDWVVVNHDFRGVVLEGDQEKVEMTYRPTSVRLGIFLALLVIGLWLGLGIHWGVRFTLFGRHSEELRR